MLCWGKKSQNPGVKDHFFHEVIVTDRLTFQALKAINKASLSTAIFAQGWVYEKHEKTSFISNNKK